MTPPSKPVKLSCDYCGLLVAGRDWETTARALDTHQARFNHQPRTCAICASKYVVARGVCRACEHLWGRP